MPHPASPPFPPRLPLLHLPNYQHFSVMYYSVNASDELELVECQFAMHPTVSPPLQYDCRGVLTHVSPPEVACGHFDCLSNYSFINASCDARANADDHPHIWRHSHRATAPPSDTILSYAISRDTILRDTSFRVPYKSLYPFLEWRSINFHQGVDETRDESWVGTHSKDTGN